MQRWRQSQHDALAGEGPGHQGRADDQPGKSDTGRQGAEGTCVTLLEHRQAPRLVAFAQALGVPFQPLA